jgi:hypothetical protein
MEKISGQKWMAKIAQWRERKNCPCECKKNFWMKMDGNSPMERKKKKIRVNGKNFWTKMDG